MNSDTPESQNNPEEDLQEKQGRGTDGFDLNIGGTGRTSAKTTESTQSDSASSEDASRQSGPANSTTENKHSAHKPPPRRPRSERGNSFNAVAWLAEGALGLVEELRHNDLGLPTEFWSHAYAAQREGLLAAKTLVDHLVECNAQKSTPFRGNTQRQQRRGSIQVE